MQVLIVGTGKLATELLGSHQLDPATWRVVPWSDSARSDVRSIVVHAGSGRELPAAIAFCQATASPLVELSTGSDLETGSHDFPVVLCPNTNILMLKFMSMLETSGPLFRDCRISVTESHQAGKTSVPGTAVGIARSLGVQPDAIRSVRDPDVQRGECGIPDDQLGRHAYHRILIEDGACSLQLESRVYGASPYADGVSRIVEAVRRHDLDNRRYSIVEFIRNGWL
ncbi:dihydrodipicolinate reductase C-terminal domain-containing protein [Burkholderia stagnalis]|uniref:dihydrodipicolinate reductase C-terminal domain-containing protein n=1 Tax=Burkholderia stagnalis TaxID=1503054 RepID=UPI00075FAAA0|nr:dihydrodipicolinate reductase C-terminal domain-containing protein [Burkholderia stagnalis]KWK15528.1 dihydrodipicolinate reductase [Burkholderia stagnalis]KWK55680.1 dihydrodipicolinate reductase [Burkholderia stagnalis]KWK56151.1 dihydrodipicolinate reductase [Burkholderia stagnalis]KWN77287.1 dihydrodipicolinate reductase [Burkholderia stagnalis]KWO17622.1 dihydrodipicolinate reductase [Burkholderia stagnalis]